MCERLRNTASRGLAPVPLTRRRTRTCRRRRAACGVLMLFITSIPGPAPQTRARGLRTLSALTGLTLLAADDLALVLDALTEVRLRRAQLANVRCNLADRLLVDAVDVYTRALDGEGDVRRRVNLHRVREAQGEHELRALQL